MSSLASVIPPTEEPAVILPIYLWRARRAGAASRTVVPRLMSVLTPVLGMAMAVGLSGCAGRPLTELADLPLPPTALSAVVATPPAAILAVGGTQQLSTSGTTLAGAPVTTFDSVVYQLKTASDTLRVRLTTAGLVTGVASSGSAVVLINAFAFKAGALRGDQVVAQVTPTAFSGLTLSVQPVASDSARLAAGTTKTIVPALRNPTTGASVATPAVKYTIKGTDSTRVDVFRGTIQYFQNVTDFLWVRPPTVNTGLASNQVVALAGEGTAWLYATVSAYGTLLQDSVQYTLTYPFTQTIATVKVNLAIQSIYAGMALTLAPGAIITFQNGVAATDPMTVAYTFDHPAAATAPVPPSTTGGASGNVTALTGTQTSRRQFNTPGAYHWTVTAAGGLTPWPGQSLSGAIVIK